MTWERDRRIEEVKTQAAELLRMKPGPSHSVAVKRVWDLSGIADELTNEELKDLGQRIADLQDIVRKES